MVSGIEQVRRILSSDEGSVVAHPPSKEGTEEGNQRLHFNTKDRDFRSDPEAVVFVEEYLKNAIPVSTDAEALELASRSVTLDGAYLEMGVCTGRTINFLAALNPDKAIHGFDSFEGLPEPWVRGDKTVPEGTFALKPGELPEVSENVQLHKGLFKDSLPAFLENGLLSSDIAFLHIDCDLYSSTKDVFDILGGRIKPGTIVAFDEFYNFPGFKLHEFKAFSEFLEQSGYKAEYIGYNKLHQQVIVRIASATV